MNTKNNISIGIWGFGKVGKAAADYLLAQAYSINIMDKRAPTPQEQQFLQEKNIIWYHENEQETFFNSSDFIIPSPGINIKKLCYATRMHKIVTELDFFYSQFKKPIIAITGSIGKTSSTHLLGQLVELLSIPVAVGGNIGIPTFDLIEKQFNVDYALLEVSSFQLMHCTKFAPHLAIWTNFYPNHLDYHTDEQEYFDAKYQLLSHQQDASFSLVPLALRTQLPTPPAPHQRSYFTTANTSLENLALFDNEHVYTIENNIILHYNKGIKRSILDITALPRFTFLENILLIVSVCDILRIDQHAIYRLAPYAIVPEHRLEKCNTFNGIDFYNDSKSTTIASTIAAIEQLKSKPLHLFIGGLSKGVDRSNFIAQLKNRVKYVYCFGKEANSLYDMCTIYQIPATCHTTLSSAIHSCFTYVKSGDCVLLSPSGSSYDLYENYEERGKHFKQLIADYIQRCNP